MEKQLLNVLQHNVIFFFLQPKPNASTTASKDDARPRLVADNSNDAENAHILAGSVVTLQGCEIQLQG